MKQKVLQIGPFVKNDQDATRMQKILVISLLPLLFFAWFKNGIYPYLHGNLTTSEMVLPLLLIFCSVVPGLLVYWLGKQIKKEKITRYHWLELLSLSFIYACLLPMQASLIVVTIGSILLSVIELIVPNHKLGNPTIISILFVLLITFVIQGGTYLNTYEVQNQLPTSSTMIENNNLKGYRSLVTPFGSIMDFLLGSVPGAIGTTSSILLGILFLYLCYKKSIKWEITVTYLLTIFGMSTFIGMFSGLGYWYPIYLIMSHSILFYSIYLITNSKTSPMTPIGKVLYGLLLGVVTILCCYFLPFEISSLISIYLFSFLSSFLDRIGSIARFHFEKSIPYFIALWIFIFGISVWIGTNYQV